MRRLCIGKRFFSSVTRSTLTCSPYDMTLFIQSLKQRGLVADCSAPSFLPDRPPCIYAGFDPTANSLHLGHWTQLLVLFRWYQAGSKVLLLMGGATAQIGDPSFRDKARDPASTTSHIVAERAHSLTQQLIQLWSRLIHQECKTIHPDSSWKCVNNLDWWESLTFMQFMQQVGQHVRISSMLARDSVKSRLQDQGLSYNEFTYQLMQAMDFSYLNQNYGCNAQLGGSDQWGNITAGLDLIQRQQSADPHHAIGKQHGGKVLFAHTTPLLLSSQGIKFGKTSGHAPLWLDAKLTSPFGLYQGLLQVSDDQVDAWLKQLTLLSEETWQSLSEPRSKQKLLAEAVTKYIHGHTAYQVAYKTTLWLYKQIAFESISYDEWKDAFSSCPEWYSHRSTEHARELTILDWCKETKVAETVAEMKRALSNGGIEWNGVTRTEPHWVPKREDCLEGRLGVLRYGKNTIRFIDFQ